MLFAGLRAFRMVKNCDGGLENAALGHSFSPYEPNLSRQITGLFFFPRSKLVLQIINGFLYGSLRNFVIESACAPSTNCKKYLQTSDSDALRREKHRITHQATNNQAISPIQRVYTKPGLGHGLGHGLPHGLPFGLPHGPPQIL